MKLNTNNNVIDVTDHVCEARKSTILPQTRTSFAKINVTREASRFWRDIVALKRVI